MGDVDLGDESDVQTANDTVSISSQRYERQEVQNRLNDYVQDDGADLNGSEESNESAVVQNMLAAGPKSWRTDGLGEREFPLH